jgi:hypothetical protein
MGSDDEIAEMQLVNKRLKAENILLRAMADAFDLIFGPADPLTDIDPPPAEDVTRSQERRSSSRSE